MREKREGDHERYPAIQGENSECLLNLLAL